MIIFRMFLFSTLLCGIIYPVLITLSAQFSMRDTANGRQVFLNGKLVGFELMGQKFEDNRYFWPRPSAVDYNPLASGGSNFGPTSLPLQKAVQERREKIGKAHNVDGSAVPNELLFASGSGLDPHISPACARFQIRRVAKARGLEEKVLQSFVEQMTIPRRLHIFGEPTVNVLLLNKALDEIL